MVRHLARVILLVFVLTFLAARILVLLIMSRRIPDLFLHLGGTHVHHLNYGIFLLSGVGGYLLFASPTPRGRDIAAVFYGVGLALTFDEFGMWLHLGGSYWQRASYDAVTVIAGGLALLSFTSWATWKRPRTWGASAGLLILLGVFGLLLAEALNGLEGKIEPELNRLEKQGPA